MCVRWNIEWAPRAATVLWSFLNTGEAVSVAVIPDTSNSMNKRSWPEPQPWLAAILPGRGWSGPGLKPQSRIRNN